MVFHVIREPDFAKRVAECRERLRLSQSDCARDMGVSRQHWNNWEIGYSKPQTKRMRQLAELLHCDPGWLQHGTGNDLDKRLANVTRLMRIVTRDLDHIHKALAAK